MLAEGTAKDDMASAVMYPFDTQAVGNTLNILNTPVARILPHFLRPLVRSCYKTSMRNSDTICDIIVNSVPPESPKKARRKIKF